MTTPNSTHSIFDGLIADALKHLEVLGYAPGTLANYRNVWTGFDEFAAKEAKSESLIHRSGAAILRTPGDSDK